MDFDLAPPTAVGPLRIGMTRHAANAALDSLRDLSVISESDRPGQHIFRPQWADDQHPLRARQA